MKYFYIIILLLSASNIYLFAQNIPPVDSCQLYVNGKTHYYGVWPSCSSSYTSCGEGCLTKPVIILNGFDPTGGRSLYMPFGSCTNDEGLTRDSCLYCVANEHGMAESMMSAGFDVIILKFADLDIIEKQADVLEALILDLNEKMQLCDNQHEFVVIGPSSGGLVARYALAEMEQNNINHNTRLYMSFDSPHRGANVPLSLQLLVKNINNIVGLGSLEIVESMYNILNSDATKQLLIYHESMTQNGHSDATSNFYDFYNSIRSLNNNIGYPKICRNIAISNGSSNSNDQGFNAGDQLFSILRPGVFSVVIRYGAAVPNNISNTVYKVYRTALGITLPSLDIPVSNTSPLDNCPGGRGAFIGQVVGRLGPFATCTANDCGEQYECFIPMISSLDLQNTVDYFYNVKDNITGADNMAFKGIDYDDSTTFFDAICISEDNEPHVINGVTDLIADFVETELMPEKYFLQNQLITKCTDYSSLDFIKMGNYVTDRKPQGEFVFGADFGTSDIVARNRVVMEPGSKLEPSGSAKIRLYTDPFYACSFISNRTFPEVAGVANSDEMKINNNGLKSCDSNVLVNVYPNPFQDSFSLDIDFDFGEEVQLQIINMQGIIVHSCIIRLSADESEFSTKISAKNLKSGMYILQLLSKTEHLTIQVIKH